MIVFTALPGLAACGANSNGNPWDAATDSDAATEVLTCTDLDGDGRGPGCSEGGDCDDSDPDVWDDCDNCASTHAEGCACEAGDSFFCYEGPAGTEGVGPCQRGVRSCIAGQLGPCDGQVLPDLLEDCEDGIDNNCNGMTDGEDFLCSDCSAPCYTEGAVEPTPSDPGASGLVPNPDGPGVILGSSEEEAGYAWIANTGEGTVSKIDIDTLVEVGRFRVGLTGTGVDAPSRTAVDSYQSAYVANRAFDVQGSVTKIAGLERYCEDRNGNGTIETSHDSTPLPLGEDECVLWTAPVGGVNGIPRALVIDFGGLDAIGGYPWVGLFNEMRFYKLDPSDGHVLETVDVNVHTYGAAIDSEGWIWISGRNSYAIQRFHHIGGVVEPPIAIPSSECSGNNPYGICLDRDDRVWVGILSGSGACRYDPDSATWFFVNLGGSGRGVAVDEDNVMWVSNYDNTQLHSFNADDGSGLGTWALPGAYPAVGVGVDKNHRIWTIMQGSNTADVFNPATSTFQSTSVGATPYTYSDFLGFQRWLMMPFGIWVKAFERCDMNDGDKWLDLRWDMETPGDSHVSITGRSSATLDGLLSATEVTIAEIAPDVDVGSRDLETVFEDAGVPLEKYLEITVIMQPSSADPPESPVFKDMQVYFHCESLG
jgi:sugar lactone lactonase YvrE